MKANNPPAISNQIAVFLKLMRLSQARARGCSWPRERLEWKIRWPGPSPALLAAAAQPDYATQQQHCAGHASQQNPLSPLQLGVAHDQPVLGDRLRPDSFH